MDFFFASKNHAQKLVEFLNQTVPHKNKESKQLVSHDTKSNNYNYKYTFFFEMPRICRYDLVILPKKLMKEFGGVNQVGVCYKITSVIHMFDPVNMRKYTLNKHQYFNNESEFTIIPFKGNETKFYITNIERDGQKFDQNTTIANIEARFARIELNRDSDHASFMGITHLGHILKHGDYVLGYDIEALNTDGEFDLLEV